MHARMVAHHVDVAFWPIATFRFATEFDRYRGIADMAGLGAGSSRSRMTHSGHLLTRSAPYGTKIGKMLANLQPASVFT
jgi:hypothetical protein